MRVLQVPYQYLPDNLGGTEVYVQSLIAELKPLGIESCIGAFGSGPDFEIINDLEVFRYQVDVEYGHIYGAQHPQAHDRWMQLCHAAKPDLVHFHSRTPSIPNSVVTALQRLGTPCIYTAHLPSFCMRGTLMEMGKNPCRGALTATRCDACMLQRSGLGGYSRTLVSHARPALKSISPLLPKKLRQLAHYPDDLEQFLGEFRRFIGAVDAVIAVCDWIKTHLAELQPEQPFLYLNRQGLRSDFQQKARQPTFADDSPLRILALGRADPLKGFHTLLDALLSEPRRPIELDLCLTQCQNPYFSELMGRIEADAQFVGKIRVHQNLQGEALRGLFDQIDVLAVPSNCVETGPLVVLEAFARGVPVIGSNLGGISELVRDGKNGWLLPATDVAAWRDKIHELANNRQLLREAAQYIEPVRTMRDVAFEHANQIYPGVMDRFKRPSCLPTALRAT